MKLILSFILIVLLPFSGFAVRPFITDDARVVGYRLAQWETWLRFDRLSGQKWHLFAYGPHRRLELTSGAVLGYHNFPESRVEFSSALPLIQGKFLFREYATGKPPGIALVAGTFLPSGRGAFVPPGYGAFTFMNITQCFGENERLLLHANLGTNYLYIDRSNTFVATYGIGAQLRTLKGFHVVGEVFSGDPYIPGTGLAYQAGFRHFFSDLLQIDATLGKGIAGDVILPFWWSVGARIVTTRFKKEPERRF